MDLRRASFRSSLAVVVPALLTLVVVGALAWSAWSARREHRRAAEETVRDYARFAATLAASNVEAATERVLLYAFYGAELAEREGSAEPVPPRVLAINPPEMGRCAARYPEGRWFVRVTPDGTMEVEGPLDPGLGRWLADTLSVLQRRTTPERHGNLFPSLGDEPVVAYRLRRDADGRPVEAHALAHCFEDAEGPVFDEARTTPLLPPAAPAGSDSLITLAVTDPRGRVLYGELGPDAPGTGAAASGFRGTSAAPSGFLGTRPADPSGPLEGLVFSVSVPEPVAEALVAGGIPRGPGATWILVVLAACLGVATLVQVHRATALARARERFVASVSHELRTPLQAVLLFAQLLRMGRASSPAEREEALGIIERETERLVALVERVLAFAGSGDVPRESEAPERTDLAEVVRETVDAFRPLAEGEGVRVRVELPADLPPVRGSPRALRQVLFDLLDNAVRHGPRGQAVEVRARAEDGRVDLVVDDEGPGIPPRERERVWEPFVRLEGGGAGEGSGSGIGLAVVRDAVEAMGGRAWIEDAPGGGARVVVRLGADGPVPGDPPSSDDAPAAAPSPAGAEEAV